MHRPEALLRCQTPQPNPAILTTARQERLVGMKTDTSYVIGVAVKTPRRCRASAQRPQPYRAVLAGRCQQIACEVKRNAHHAPRVLAEGPHRVAPIAFP